MHNELVDLARGLSVPSVTGDPGFLASYFWMQFTDTGHDRLHLDKTWHKKVHALGLGGMFI